MVTIILSYWSLIGILLVVLSVLFAVFVIGYDYGYNAKNTRCVKGDEYDRS